VAHEAQRRGYQGVVCGHIHHAEIRDIDGVTYCNDGDWVESLSALVEHEDGRFELLYWPRNQAISIPLDESLPMPTPLPQPMPLPQPLVRESSSSRLDHPVHG
jgi:hypothetical protein